MLQYGIVYSQNNVLKRTSAQRQLHVLVVTAAPLSHAAALSVLLLQPG
jgi:hypothetical protein